MDRPAFYRALRARDNDLFGTSLSQKQVDGMEALLDALHGFSLDHAAHVFAEVYHETGGGMYPVKETVYSYSKVRNPSDATVIKRLEAAYQKGQLPWVSAPYWREGWFGRGQIQLTHRRNYAKMSALVGADLVAHPEEALVPTTSAKIAAEGCRLGIFTGKKLSDFDAASGYDHYNARAIVNGDKKKNGGSVASYAKSFTAALRAGEWGYPPRPDVEPPETPQRASGWLVRLVQAVMGMLRRG